MGIILLGGYFEMIGKIFAFIAGFLAGTIFGGLVVALIINWIETKGGVI